MKNSRITIISFVIILCSCGVNKRDVTQSGKKRFSQRKDVMSLNAINADFDQYSKAIFNYKLTEKIISDYSSTYPDSSLFNIDPEQRILLRRGLFQQVSGWYNDLYDNSTDSADLASRGMIATNFIVPERLVDLNGGFQFSNYIFKGSNQSAMQAFGITNSDFSLNTTYVVIDYIQYKDIEIMKFPKIRYAIGIRAELRIDDQSFNSTADIKSLANLAAQVETEKKSINITIKTIGITGLESRMAIPNNTTFDVKTFSEYEKIIDFIRELNDLNNDALIIKPQRIPIMDDYSASSDYSFYSKLESIEMMRKKLRSSRLKRDDKRKIKASISKMKVELMTEEVNRAVLSRQRQLFYEYLLSSNSLNPMDFMSDEAFQNWLRSHYAIETKD